MTTKKTGAERQAALREKGRQVAVILRNPAAIRALDLLAEKRGGITAAISFSLIEANKQAVARNP